MQTHKRSIRTGALRSFGLGAIALTLALGPASLARAQGQCERALTEAEQKYYATRFDEAIDLLTRCLESNELPTTDRPRAYRLVGLAYLAKDYLEQAKDAVEKLLELVPTYEPDPDQDPPKYTNLVKQIKESLEALKREKKEKEGELKKPAPTEVAGKEPQVTIQPAKKGGGMKWLWIGGGVVVAGGVAAALAGGGGNGGGTTTPTPLPIPPDPPSQ